MEKVFSVDDYLSHLEPWMQEKLTELRQLLSTFPEIKERIRYNAPFYDYQGMMLYAGIYRKNRLVIGFCDGKHHSDKNKILIADAGQTQIRHWELHQHQSTDLITLAAYVEEAMQIRDAIKLQKHGTKHQSSRTGR